ncbi:hypothetical protein CCR75_005216 [Bremia lactucae]|uniref:Uncharacterized protein n=1 Tax=Bremia lactucae TaxID=4779 RepID=A0A976FGL1_BRELC|nr:hypothetical protein CCR75_005216 [Bremia lactucae]
MPATSMRVSDKTFGGMNSGNSTCTSSVFHTLSSPTRQRHFELEKLRELARSDEFSDSESDGVSEDGKELDMAETTPKSRHYASSRWKSIDVHHWYQNKLQKKGDVKEYKAHERAKDNVNTSNKLKADEWEIVNKSPTFGSVDVGKSELGGESWFLQDCD